MKKTKRVYVIKEVGVIRKLWHIFLTLVLKREIKVYGRPKFPHGKPNDMWISPHFLCPGCLKYQDWDFGAADDYPALCDNCWESKNPCGPNSDKHKKA